MYTRAHHTSLNYIGGKIYLNSDTKYTILDLEVFFIGVLSQLLQIQYIFSIYMIDKYITQGSLIFA